MSNFMLGEWYPICGATGESTVAMLAGTGVLVKHSEWSVAYGIGGEIATSMVFIPDTTLDRNSEGQIVIVRAEMEKE